MKKGFKLFNYDKPGKGVKKEATDYSLVGFFKLFKRKFFDLSKVNFLWVLMNFPLFFGLVGLSGNFSVPFSTPADPLYPIISGVSKISQSPSVSALWGVLGKNTVAEYYGDTARVLFYLTALVILTFGLANTGMAYVLRNHAREEYVDMPADFFRAIKNNFWQGLLLGIVDIALSAMMVFDLVFFAVNSGVSFMFSMMFFFCIFLALVWVIMRFYMYQILVTFELSIFKVLKNSFIFALVGLKRNILAVIGVALTVALNVVIYIYFLPLGGLLPFFITVALTTFMGTFAAYPNIKKIMIDPYYKSTDHVDDTPDEPSLFRDRG